MMRASKLTDLIYSSNGTRPDFAEVSIKFDNLNGNIPAKKDEINVRRTIRQTENGYYSNYYLNGKSCGLGEVHRYLAGVDIPPEGSNIILQGDVTRIFEMNSIGRRKIIEEITGVAEFDEKKDKAFEELTIVKNKISMIEILLSEVDKRLEQLKVEKSLAIKYNELKSEKDRLERQISVIKINNLKKELDRIERDISEKQLKRDSIAKDLSEKTSKILDLEACLQEINDQISKMGEGKADEIKKEIDDLLGSISRCEGLLELSDTELKRMESEGKKTLFEAYKEHSKLIGALNKIKEENEVKNVLLSEIDELKSKLDEFNQEISSIDEEFGEGAKNIEKLKLNLDIEKNNKNELLRKKDRLLDALNRRSSDIKRIKEELKRNISEKSELEVEKEVIGKSVRLLSDEIKVITEDLKALYDEKNRVIADIRGIENKLQVVREKYARKVAIMNASEKTGKYSHSVSSILDASNHGVLKGIYGTVADLCNVDDKFAVALEIAAGNRMQCLVVDNDENASNSLTYLKENASGRATFLPLNKMAAKRPNNGVNDEGVIGYAINLIDFDPKFDPAFWYVFRDTLVVDSLNTARRLINKYRMVTLDGEIVEKGGAMTGGSAKSRFLVNEKEINSLKDQISKYEQEKGELIELSNTIDDHINTQKNESFKTEGELNKRKLSFQSTDDKLKRLDEDINHLETKLLDTKAEEDGLSKEMRDLGEKIKDRDSKITEYLAEIEKNEQALEDSKVQKLSKEANELIQNIQKIESDVRNSEISIKELSLEKTYTEKRIDEIKTKICEFENKKLALNEKIKGNKQDIVTLTTELDSKRALEKEFSDELVESRKKRDEKLNEISSLDRKKEEDKRQYERLGDSISSSEVMKNQLLSDLDELKSEIKEDDFSEIEVEFNSPKDIRKKILEIVGEMENLGPVNLRAIEEFDSVFSRQNDIKSRKSILWTERKEIISKIKKYEVLKKETFMEAFDVINENFKSIYSELSDGYGELTLDNYDDPFAGGLTIKVQPSGKNIMRLESMSGGEKSLAALSFLFALQRFRPASFYALDEIDMFLDGANVEKVANMIKKLSDDAQFIVVSLRKPMIEAANSMIGVVMQENNISSVTGVRLNSMA